MIPAGRPQVVVSQDYYAEAEYYEPMPDLYFSYPGTFSNECREESDVVREWARRADEDTQGPRFIVYCCPDGANSQGNCPEHGDGLKEPYAETLTHLGLPSRLDWMFTPNPMVDEGG